MYFVDEDDDLTLRGPDLVEDSLQTLLKFAAVLRTSDHRCQIQLHNPLLAQPLRHITANDPLCKTLDNCCLPDSWLADQHGVVLGAPQQYLNDAADLIVAPDHRIELALARKGRQIATIALERLIG